MDRGDEPERIEIELTSHDPKAARATPQESRDVVAAESIGVEPAVVVVERNRLIIAGSMIGLVAVLLGFVLGRAGSSDDAVPTAATSASPVTTVDESVTSIESPAEFKDLEAPPTTERARRTTTTTQPPAPEAGSMAINPWLAGLEMDVITLNRSGQMVIVDVASGATTTYDTNRFSSGGPGNIVAGDGWVLLPDFNGGETSTLVLDDGSQSQVETGPGWRLLMGRGSDVFWRFDFDGDAPSIAFETRYDGTPTGVEIDLPAPPIATDPLGGLVISSGSGAYRVEAGGAQQLTSGQLVAVGRERTVAYECDEVLRCAYVVEERSTGDRRVLDVTGVDRGVQVGANGWYPFGADFDVGETRVIVTAWQAFADGLPSRGILDLDTGVFAEIDADDDFAEMHWSEDGQFVFVLSGSTLEVFDPDTGETARFSHELGSVAAFAVRPSG